MRTHFSFFLFFHQLKSNYNAPSCGSQPNTHHSRSLLGEEIATDTTEFVLRMSQLIFVSMPSHILLPVSLSVTTDHGSK